MRSINEWFDGYAADHQHPTNIAIHWVCVPAIFWAVIAALWTAPVPAFLQPGSWAIAAMLLTYFFYHGLSRRLAYAMAAVFVLAGVITALLYRYLGANALLWLAIAVFVAAWVGQFAGHRIEGHKPSFLTDVVYLLIGPAWLTAKLCRRWGLELN